MTETVQLLGRGENQIQSGPLPGLLGGTRWESPLSMSKGTGESRSRESLLKKMESWTVRVFDIRAALDLQNYLVQSFLIRMRNFFLLKHKHQVRVPWGPFHHHLHIPSAFSGFTCPLSTPAPPSLTEFSFFLIHPLTLASCFCLPDIEDFGEEGRSATCQLFCSFTYLSPSIPYVYISQSLEMWPVQ